MQNKGATTKGTHASKTWTGTRRNMQVITRSNREAIVASPYFTGEDVAKCMDEPLYDVVIGNVQGARDVLDLNPNWRSEDETEAADLTT